MRFVCAIIAIAWLGPRAAFADDPPTSEALEARIARLEAELADLKATTDAALAVASGGDAVKDPIFRIFGFIDMGLYKEWATDDPISPTQKTTFVLGNVNLYFDFHPAPDWSSLVEVRFTNYPNGSSSYGVPQLGVPYRSVDTTVRDPGNGPGFDSVRWGSIVLERAYLQWQRSAKLGVRVGQFLTPYGIWNVDHGTPTLISLFRPQLEAGQMFPEHQLGVELFGRYDDLPLERWQLEYHAYVSNGRTPGPVALTNDKMVGGRVVVTRRDPRALAFGLSVMRGRYVDQQVALDAVTAMTTRNTVVAYYEYAGGIDASLDLGALRLRGEAALRRRRYDPGRRDPSYLPGVFVADGDDADVYALAAYRIADTRLEPYLYGEWYRSPTPIGQNQVTGSAGLNLYFTPAIQLKLQYSMSEYVDQAAPQFAHFDTRSQLVAGKLVMGF